jgi:H+-transporting ATPase
LATDALVDLRRRAISDESAVAAGSRTGQCNVLCADKTVAPTQNALSVTQARPPPGFDEAHVLTLGALARSEGGQDPVDEAIRLAAVAKHAADAPKLAAFTPFDPVSKTSGASAMDSDGATQRVAPAGWHFTCPPSPRRRSSTS